MSQLEKLETTLDDVLNKKAPVKIPENGRKTLAGALWWLALIGGVAQLYFAWVFWRDWHRVDEALGALNSWARAYGVDTGVADLGFFFYLSIAVLAFSGVLLLMASTGLKAMKKSGWDLLFYGLLVNLVYGIVVAFTDYGTLGDLFGALLGSLIGAYLLFQVRGHFMKSHVATHKA